MTEKSFLDKYDGNQYEKMSVTVDLALFSIMDDEIKVLLINRGEYPFKGYLSLPGAFVGINETLDDTVKRCLKQKAGLENIYFEQLYTWGDVNRDPRMRIVSVSYYALLSQEKVADMNIGSEHFYSVKKIIEGDKKLAFDHKKIIKYGRERIKNKTEYTDIAFELAPEDFTLPQLQRVYEILLDKPLYKANFRKKVVDRITETEKMTSGDCHRPSRIYNKK